jgi:hypothetical protein
MVTSIRKKIAVIAATLALALIPAVAVVAPAYAATGSDTEIQHQLKCGSNLVTDGTKCDTNTGATNVDNLIRQVINFFSALVGIVSVVMIIYGGFKYVTSGGDSGNVTGAKNTIIYAVIGLVIVAMAQFIVQFVLDKAISTT